MGDRDRDLHESDVAKPDRVVLDGRTDHWDAL